MKAYVQWATTTPSNWEKIDLYPNAVRSAWDDLPKKAEPDDNSVLDNQPGWIFSINVQGLLLYGFDHYCLEPIPDGIRMYGWSTDTRDTTGAPDDAPYKWGEVWDVYNLRPDETIGGKLNTYQFKRVYTENFEDMLQFFPQETTGGPVDLLPWEEFPTPPEESTRHGIWIRDEQLWQRHFDVRETYGWRDWI